MALLACALLTACLGVYIFLPERQLTRQREKTRSEFLEERKAVLYENLRDLRFEQASGKYTPAEFAEQQFALEGEAAEVVRELDLLAQRGPAVEQA